MIEELYISKRRECDCILGKYERHFWDILVLATRGSEGAPRCGRRQLARKAVLPCHCCQWISTSSEMTAMSTPCPPATYTSTRRLGSLQKPPNITASGDDLELPDPDAFGKMTNDILAQTRRDLRNLQVDKKVIKLICSFCGKTSDTGKLATCARCRYDYESLISPLP